MCLLKWFLKIGFILFLENVHFAKKIDLTILSKFSQLIFARKICMSGSWLILIDCTACDMLEIALFIWYDKWVRRDQSVSVRVPGAQSLSDGTTGQHWALAVRLNLLWHTVQVYHDNTYFCCHGWCVGDEYCDSDQMLV